MRERTGATGLATNALTVRYGGVIANDAITLAAPRGAVTGLIGPNGAGKTSYVDAITGFTPATGSVTVDGVEVSALPAHRRPGHGLVRTWQAGDLFDDITVEQNLLVAATGFSWRSPVRDVFRPRSGRDPHRVVDEALERLGLSEVRHLRPSALSLGQRKLVGVGRSLAMSPRVLLLDEPAAGLDSAESMQLGSVIQEIAADGIGVLLIEHDIDLVLSICNYLYVLDYGRVLAEGTAEDIRQDPVVIAAYLGGPAVEELTE